MKKNQFLESFYLLEKDLEVLTKNKIAVYDLLLYNSVLKKGILYHIDYGSFKKCKDAVKINGIMYNSFAEGVLKRISFLQNGFYPEWVLSSDRLEILKRNMGKKETVKEFVKRMV